MESGFMAVGAAAVAYYVYSRTRRDLPNGIVETHRHVEQAPQNWTGELYLFAEALRYLYLEYITHWQTADLFIGLFYLARQGIRDFPAAEVVAHGTRLHPRAVDTCQLKALKNKFEVMYRLLIYSQKLRFMSTEIPTEEWIDLEICVEDFLLYRPKASVLCPAYVIVKDSVLNCFVLAIRGTHSTRDIFTSLSGAAKPHHYVDNHGVTLGHSHFGMLAGARWIFKHCKEILCKAHEQQPDYRLVITGHSMGGGAAAMLTMMVREQLPQFGDVQCYTFACPGCMTLELAQSCSSYVTTLIYGTDVVPTISPGAGDLLREEVAQSAWTTAFKEDIRSSVFVQSVESRVKGFYRSASTWTLRQARSISTLTTRCVRPRDKPSTSQSMKDLCSEELTESLTDKDHHEKEMEQNTSISSGKELTEAMGDINIAEKSERIESPVQDEVTLRPSSTNRSSYVSDLWSKISSYSWRRKTSDSDTLIDESAATEETDVEGVFNAQGLGEDDAVDVSEASTSNPTTSAAKRLLFPAGKIFHLVPEYILKADSSQQGAASEDQEEEHQQPGSIVDDTWYHPRDHGHEEEDSAFVLFSDLPQEAYGRIRVCRSMVMDHFLPRYKVALKSALQELEAVLEDENTQHI